jgi:uncharacterized membrane protein YdbT with pleckstrin-like domain
VYGSANTHLLHESIVLVIERIIVVQIIVALLSVLVYAAILGITDSPSLLTIGLAGFALQTTDAVLIAAVILNWERTSFFITPSEVVIRRGVIELKEKVYPYSDIESIELSQDVLGKVLNYGSVYFYSQKAKEEIGITNIGRPHDYLEVLEKFKQNQASKPKIS